MRIVEISHASFAFSGSAPHLALAIVTSLTYITSIDMLLTTVFIVSSGSLLKPKDGVL